MALHELKSTLKLYTPTEMQREVDSSRNRFNAACWGRQSGKTTYGWNKTVGEAWEGPTYAVYWYILQTSDAARIIFRRAKRALEAANALRRKPHETELWLALAKPGVDIFFKSGEVLDNLRSESLCGAVIDEYRLQHPELWPMVIRPMLGQTGGWADVLSTPNGFDHFFDLFENAKTDPDWGHFHAPSWYAPWWTPEEIASAKRTMTQAEFDQEIGAQFRELKKGRAYHAYQSALHENPISPFTNSSEISKHLPIVVAPDFNLNPMAWALGQQRIADFYWHDEIFLENSHTQEASKVLVEKVKHHKPGIVIAGDATSKASQRAAAGKSDYDILCAILSEAGVRWTNLTPDANPTIKDRVNTTNARFMNAAGEVHMWHHPRTVKLKRDWQRVTWKETSEFVLDPGKKKDLTHSSDGPGYALCALSPLPSTVEVGTLRVIPR